MAAPGLRWLVDMSYLKGNGIETILDFGAGHGRNARYLRDQGYKVYAYDPSHGTPDADPWTGITNIVPPIDLHFNLLLTSFVLNVVPVSLQNQILRVASRYADQAVHIVRFKDLISQLKGNIVKYRKYWEDHGIAHLDLIEKAKYGFPTTKGYQRYVDIDGYESKNFHVSLAHEKGNWRIFIQYNHPGGRGS